jgi:tetratricopeptide (TPR) repeat protein
MKKVKLQSWLICLGLVLVTVAVYWPVTKNGFINLDDPDYVTGNPRVQAGLSPASIHWAFTSYFSGNWHPLTWMSHMLDCQLFGLRPAGHHLVNLAFHLANTLLCFGLLRRLTGAIWPSAFVAALFALHPLHVESVAWVAERKDVLSGFFFFLTLLAYERYTRAGARDVPGSQQQQRSRAARMDAKLTQAPAPLRAGDVSRSAAASKIQNPSIQKSTNPIFFYLLALLAFTLGLMSKPMLVTLPFVLLLLDFWPLNRLPFKNQKSKIKNLLVEKLPFFALSLASCVVTFMVQRASGAVVPMASAALEPRVTNAIVGYGSYLLKTIWPVNLAVFYPFVPYSFGSWQVLLGLLVLVAITALALRQVRQRPFLLIGWLWFIGMLVPVIGLVQVGKQAMADRYTYLPHVGLFVAIAGLFAKRPGFASHIGDPESSIQDPQPPSSIKNPGSRIPSIPPISPSLHHSTTPAALLASATLLACALLTAHQVSFWRNDKTLFTHAFGVTSGNFLAHGALANALFMENNLEAAAQQCQIAIQESPTYAEAYVTLGHIHLRQGQFDQAVHDYQAALAADSSYPDAYNGLGNALLKQGKFAEAEAACREAVARAPLNLNAMYNLATALHNEGKLDEAAQWYRKLLEIDPKLGSIHRSLGNILVLQGKAQEAIPQFETAIKLRPNEPDPHVVLGIVLLESGRADEAANHFQAALQLQPTNSMALYQLARIQQGRGEIQEAIANYHKAIQSQPDWPAPLNDLAWVLAASADANVRNGTNAVALAERACKLTQEKEPLFLGTLAAAYAEAARFQDAVATAEKAKDLASKTGLKEVAQKNEELLQAYRAGKPYHEPK